MYGHPNAFEKLLNTLLHMTFILSCLLILGL